ncbi:phosphatidylglycerophosphatase A [Candidatus Dependentiae bacterium]|nr:phosphatidylglycerophosphatase A [Candidatus Dependentiae bacterium]
MMHRYIRAAVTLGPIGYWPAPGTIASVLATAAIGILWALQLPAYLMILMTLVLPILAWWMIRSVLPTFYTHDPAAIVIDEVVGIAIAFLGLSAPMPHALLLLGGGLLLFRIFDISKIIGIHALERLPGAYGILGDDIVAGIYTNLLLQLLWRCYCSYCMIL